MADTNDPGDSGTSDSEPMAQQTPEPSPPAAPPEADNSLEAPPDTVESEGPTDGSDSANPDDSRAKDGADSDSKTPAASPSGKSDTPSDPHHGKPPPVKWLRRHTNMYTLLFVLIIVVAIAVVLIAYRQNKHSAKGNQIKTQGLSQSTLDQLANSDVTVGNNQSVLTVQSSAIFAGQVLIKQSLEVAGDLKIGGTVSLSNIAVNGTGQFGQLNVSRDLAVSGNTAMQGTATISKSLQVGGGGTFSGPLSAPQITTGSLQLNGDLVLTHHVTASGGQPGHSGGSALGSGGSASLSGSDTAGSININTGGGPAAGCFVTVNFTSHYNATPHVIITPVGAAAGSLSYYVNRSTTNFSICDASPPPAGSSFGFDYFVID